MATLLHPPSCPFNATHCDEVHGGGCCPEGTECSLDGCLRTLNAATRLGGWDVLESIMETATGTVTAALVTQTEVKMGEVAQKFVFKETASSMQPLSLILGFSVLMSILFHWSRF